MPLYKVHYKTDRELSHVVFRDSMAFAVEAVLEKAKEKGVKVSNISVTIASESKGGVQRFCDTCLVKMASYGVGNKWYCKECKQLRGN